jgi:hypothetical protein
MSAYGCPHPRGGDPHTRGGDPHARTLGSAIEADGTCWDASPMSPSTVSVLHANAVQAARLNRRRRAR